MPRKVKSEHFITLIETNAFLMNGPCSKHGEASNYAKQVKMLNGKAKLFWLVLKDKLCSFSRLVSPRSNCSV